MIVLVSFIVLLRRLLVSTIFSMVHPYIAIHFSILVSHIFATRVQFYMHSHVNATP